MKRSPRIILFLVTLAACAFIASPAAAQEGPLDNALPTGIKPEKIIPKCAAQEKLFKEAREQYTYRQDIKVQTRDCDQVAGECHEVFDVLYDDKGHRIENVVFAPQSSLEQGGLSLDEGAVQDFRNRLPFVLTTDEIPEYNILYVGQQQEDALHCYVFDIAPKQIVGKKRYFQGRIWVDDHDFQIVETYGKTVPDIKKKKGKKKLFPKFTTWREQIDGQYWFPTYTRAEDTLQFSLGGVKIREIIKYTNYKRFGSKSRITYDGQEVQKAQPKPDDQKPAEPPKPQ